MVKNLPAMQETRVRSLGGELPLEKGMATHPSILAWRIPWTEEPGRIQSLELQRVGRDWGLTRIYTHIFKVLRLLLKNCIYIINFKICNKYIKWL